MSRNTDLPPTSGQGQNPVTELPNGPIQVELTPEEAAMPDGGLAAAMRKANAMALGDSVSSAAAAIAEAYAAGAASVVVAASAAADNAAANAATLADKLTE